MSEEFEANIKKKPTVLLVIGMAGSGKTTFVQRINSYLSQQKTPPYLINLDPAVTKVPYPANIDIRKTVNYKNVMNEFDLGPNGAIMTSLNLFTTKFDQVLDIVDKKASELKNVVIDTPGQIEIFTWSASGSIITDTLASSYPTVVVYIVDTTRTENPMTFMSNMLYACSILYKSQLPFILVFNKTDIVSHHTYVEWLRDFEKFQEALQMQEESYLNSLMNSMCLVLEEFYNNLNVVGVSSHTGMGIDEFFEKVDVARNEFFSDYLPSLLKKIEEREKAEQQDKQRQLQQLMKDMEIQEK